MDRVPDRIMNEYPKEPTTSPKKNPKRDVKRRVHKNRRILNVERVYVYTLPVVPFSFHFRTKQEDTSLG